MKWKPIHTYKVGTNEGDQGDRVIVYSWGRRKTFIGTGERVSMGLVCFLDDDGYVDGRVSHWMHLPKLPEGA